MQSVASRRLAILSKAERRLRVECNADKRRESDRRRGKGKWTYKSALRRARKLKATPKWIDMNLVKDMYEEAKYQGLVVDHIVPLRNRLVCGLHWEGNLQLLTFSENSRKRNSFKV